MDDQDRITDGVDENRTPPVDQPEGEGVPIPSRIRIAVNDVRERLREDSGSDVVKEYEERYHGRRRLETPAASQQEEPIEGKAVFVPHYKPKRVVNPATVSDNERKWAAIAHGSTLLTAVLGIVTGGAAVLITMFVPLLIYFSFRKRSEFVAFHALQAFTLQLVGTIGWVALITVGTIAWLALLVVSALLILLLIGLILLPLVFLAGLIFYVLSLALPLGMVIYSVIAMVETHAGHNYRIPYISRWVESQMYSSVLTIL